MLVLMSLSLLMFDLVLLLCCGSCCVFVVPAAAAAAAVASAVVPLHFVPFQFLQLVCGDAMHP
jgi:hypothetical protein